MPDHLRWIVCSVPVLLLAAGGALAQQAKKPVGFNAGEEMPFFVVDFVSGEHKDHGGCPGVIISNHQAQGVILIARDANEPTLALAQALSSGVDGKKVLGFLCVPKGREPGLAAVGDKAGLKTISAGHIRDQSWQRLQSLGLTDDIAVAAILLDRKAVQSSYLLKSGGLTAEKQQEIVAALAALAK